MIRVKLLPPLSRLVGRKELQVDLATTTLDVLLERLIHDYPRLATELGPESGGKDVYYAIFVNGVDSRSRQGRATPVASGDEVAILMPMGGGACC